MTDTTQTVTELQAMTEALAKAVTLFDLDRLYVKWVGYSMVEDDPTTTVEGLRELLTDWLFEVKQADGPHFAFGGGIYPLPYMLRINAQDGSLCDWLRAAKVGDVIDGCRRVA